MHDDSTTSEITLLIDGARKGDPLAENELCEKIYEELHRIAQRLMPSDDSSLQPSMLVNDLWVKLFSNHGLKKTENRRYFYTVAADQMRKILIDHYRKKKNQKAGGDRKREPIELILDGALEEFESKNDSSFEQLDDALQRLKSQNRRQYQVVMHRFFAGLTIEQTANLMGVSESSVERDWRLARAKLYADLKKPEVDSQA